MRTAQPVMKEGALGHILHPSSAGTVSPRDRTSAQGALVREDNDPLQLQGMSINQISSTVSDLHDSMAELKSAFTALRIELNGSGLESGSNNFEMVSIVLRELKAKSDETERLRLEVEALKAKYKYVEGRLLRQSPPVPTAEGPFLEVQDSLSRLPDSRKRLLEDSFPNGRTQPVSGPFDDDDDEGILSNCVPVMDVPQQPIKVPLREPGLSSPLTETTVGTHTRTNSPREQGNDNEGQENVVVKRPRLSQPESLDGMSSRKTPERRASTRTRKASSQPPNAGATQTPKPVSSGEANGDASAGRKRGNSTTTKQRPSESSGSAERPAPDSNPRNLRSRSRPPSFSRPKLQPEPGGNSPLERSQRAQSVNVTVSNSFARGKTGAQNVPGNKDLQDLSEGIQESIRAQELHKSKVSSRDNLAKLTMKREEAMDTEQGQANWP